MNKFVLEMCGSTSNEIKSNIISSTMGLYCTCGIENMPYTIQGVP